MKGRFHKLQERALVPVTGSRHKPSGASFRGVQKHGAGQSFGMPNGTPMIDGIFLRSFLSLSCYRQGRSASLRPRSPMPQHCTVISKPCE